jgi:hypothetical protein
LLLPAFEVTIAVITARMIAPPTWKEVFSRPEARPGSWSAIPSVACMFSAGRQVA